MHRLLVTTESILSDAPTLSPEARRHLKVLRLKPGEPLELFDGEGRTRIGEEVRFHPKPAPLTLFACVTKGSRWDWTVEKATELGVTRIVPVLSARTIVRLAPGERPAKALRWRRVAEEAARQSDAVWLPEILAPVDFPDVLPPVAATRCFVGALTDPPPPPLLSALTRLSTAHCSLSTDLALFVGPEGDFTPEELSALLAIATPVSLGPTVLRAETAAIYGLSVLAAYNENLLRHR